VWKEEREEIEQTKSGREFQIVEAAKEKEHQPVVDLTKGTDKRFLFADRDVQIEEEGEGDQRDMVVGVV